MKILFTDNIFVRGFWFDFFRPAVICVLSTWMYDKKNMYDFEEQKPVWRTFKWANGQAGPLCLLIFIFILGQKQKQCHQSGASGTPFHWGQPASRGGGDLCCGQQCRGQHQDSFHDTLLIFPSQVCVCGEFDWQTWDQVEKQVCLRVKKKKVLIIKRNFHKIRIIGYAHFLKYSIFCFFIIFFR